MDRGWSLNHTSAARELLFVLTERPPSLRTRGVCCGPVILTLFTGQLYVPVTGEACVTYKCSTLSPPRSLPADSSMRRLSHAFSKYQLAIIDQLSVSFLQCLARPFMSRFPFIPQKNCLVNRNALHRTHQR